MNLKRTIIFASLILTMGSIRTYGQTDAELRRMAASQAGSSPLFFDPSTEKIPAIGPGSFSDARELNIRGGLPNLFAKIKAGKHVTVGYIGGSITQALYGYRIQSAQFIQSQFPKTTFKWMNAGVSGTGTDLGACRIGEQLLKHHPDLVFIEFAVNGGYNPGMEGMIRQIIRNNPETDICLIYTVLQPQAAQYRAADSIPVNLKALERIATHYNLPSIHLGIEAAMLEDADKLVWKGDAKAITDKIVFSADGIHPLLPGGNLYAAAIARSLPKLATKAGTEKHVLPAPLIAGNWEDAKMIDPLEVVQFSKGWTKTETKGHAFLKQFSSWFPYVMESGTVGASFSFTFKGTMFGIFNVGGPEVGQLSVKVDGKAVKLQEMTGKGFRLYKATQNTGSDVVNLFNNFCNNRYRGQYDFIEVEDGVHTVTFTISDQKADKRKILGESQLKDITENPEKYDRTMLYLGKILLRGEIVAAGTAATPVYKDKNAPVEARVNDLLSKMTLEEKIDYIGGFKGFYIRGIERLGLPEIKLTDGPVGTHKDGKSTAYPASVLSAATWDTALVYELGKELARDSKARGVHILLAPGVNILRAPMAGRNFEYFSEDPLLNARIAVAYVKGLQDNKVVATVKHYAANNQEWDRNNVSSDIDERTLHEIYLPAYKATVQDAKTGSIMNSYNPINGVHATQHDELNNQILKKDWGFDGFVMSDWSSIYDGIAAANGGLDLEMPRARFMTKEKLMPAIQQGLVKESTIDDKVKRMLRIIFRFGFFENVQLDQSIPLDNPDAAKVALELARGGIVLLKNEKNVLPLDITKTKTLAVIGPNANAYISGGGSSYTFPFHSVSTLQGIQQVAPNVQTLYAAGLPTLPDLVAQSVFYTEKGSQVKGLKAEYFSNIKLTGNAAKQSIDTVVSINNGWHIAAENQGIPFDHCSMRWTGVVRPDKTTGYRFIVRGFDGFRLYIDSALVINEWRDQGITTREAVVQMQAGKEYSVRLEYFANVHPVDITFAWREDKILFDDAIDAAKKSDAAIVCIGFNESSERESNDRSFVLPQYQDSLIQCIYKANPNTIVLLNAGGNADMQQWINKVPALLHSWYAGQEGGTAIAEILFGKVNPSAKLPVSFEKKWEDNPAANYYYDPANTKRVAYKEGIFMGYRHYDQSTVKPVFPFGYGLSYTSFQYSNLTVKNEGKAKHAKVKVQFDITNTGKAAGAEVAQVYVRELKSKEPRPYKELKAFSKTFLKQGEKKTITITLNADAFSYYSTKKHGFVYDAGDFEIIVASSAEDIRTRKTIRIK